MFLLENGTVVYSASDLTAASNCEWATMRKLDARLGRVQPPPETTDDMLERTARLGDVHEERFLQSLREHGPVVEIERPHHAADPSEAVAATTLTFAAGAPVVYQAAFFDGRFLGFADFIIRTVDGGYEVYDTKLARHAKVTALLQLAAYSEQLQRLDIPTGEHVYLVLGDNSTSVHRLSDIAPVFHKRRARLEQIIDERVADSAATEWGDPRYTACGRCAACDEQVQSHRDVLLVAGMRVTQRARLIEAGIRTIDQLARRDSPVPGIADVTLHNLREQASVQLESVQLESVQLESVQLETGQLETGQLETGQLETGQLETGQLETGQLETGQLETGRLEPGLAWKVMNPNALAALPASDAGDIFFDFEGDPLYQEGTAWGLDYLFGLVEPDETFRSFWAHDLADEKRALIEFLDFVGERRKRHPGMHIYHYASYERSHLLSIAARHGVGEAAVDDLLRNGVLIDLYPIVKQSLRIGSRSYSLKKLEPLYMGKRGREGVSTAADSITEYVRARDLAGSGQTDAAAAVLARIADYNEYDCISTLALRDWLRTRALEHGIAPGSSEQTRPTLDIPDADPVYVELAAIVESFPVGGRTADQTAIALASAAIDYHRREGKSFWWDHFSRLSNPTEDWADTRNVFLVEAAQVVRRWGILGRAHTESRTLRLHGVAAPGSSFGGAEQPYVLYDEPFPPIEPSEPGARVAHSRSSIEIDEDGSVLLTERLKGGAPPYGQLPVALTPGVPPNPGTQVTAISEWGRQLLDALPEMLPDAALDLMRRRPPRVIPGSQPPPTTGTTSVTEPIRDYLLCLDRSYLAVQGPPGTGKTWSGARVIADLVRNHGWKIGVVAQSHATVENMLAAVVAAGLDRNLVGKVPRGGEGAASVPWTKLTDRSLPDFSGQPGFVIGGTAWLFSNAGRIPRGSLDLLVIDEAGQFSLASTIAASVGAKRLLLLGDPQQLPQVSQGSHPEPVDESALGWLSDGHDVLPAEFGFFLGVSHRMHPAVCAPVSALSYEGRLSAHDSDRLLEGIQPGVHGVPTTHTDNSTSSVEEAETVLAIVRDVIGRPWSSGGSTAPLSGSDIIVVAPYNAQVELLRHTLDEAGFVSVPVGTVDKFQGREAAVSIVSLAASSAADVPRGLEFLLLANRLNVAVSRAQWAAYLVYSPTITQTLPPTVEGLARLSAFIQLAEGTTRAPTLSRPVLV